MVWLSKEDYFAPDLRNGKAEGIQQAAERPEVLIYETTRVGEGQSRSAACGRGTAAIGPIGHDPSGRERGSSIAPQLSLIVGVSDRPRGF